MGRTLDSNTDQHLHFVSRISHISESSCDPRTHDLHAAQQPFIGEGYPNVLLSLLLRHWFQTAPAGSLLCAWLPHAN